MSSSQRCDVLFRQTLPFAVRVHPLIALNAAVKPLTPSIDFDLRVITDAAAFPIIIGHAREVITS